MKKQQGFTLVEAAIAIGVVAILSGIIVPLVIKNLNDARVARARNDIAVIAGAIAHQIRDTATRPRLAAGDGNGDGRGNAMWFSGGPMPSVDGAVPGGADPFPGAVGNQTFYNLFGRVETHVGAYSMFGFNAVAGPQDQAGYRGPYMGDLGALTDPWGRSYVILGYNADGEASRGPIWVVSAGASRTLAAGNLIRQAGVGGRPATYRQIWDYTGDVSATNIAVRVN